ncbi:hypothetical protein H2203_001804 [Taxawa tesnikishii (nom. ined.)]|nr:hypothetical protein H2203_001804 [Dothideales sp. JES 119]
MLLCRPIIGHRLCLTPTKPTPFTSRLHYIQRATHRTKKTTSTKVNKQAEDIEQLLEEPSRLPDDKSRDEEPLDLAPSGRKRGRKPNPIHPAITPGSSKHHDLASFMAYAERQGLPRSTNVFVGIHYEYTVAAVLQNFGFALTRTGRASDLGIDLLGHWTLPGAPGEMRVLVQCKAEKPRPTFVRELEGAYVGAPAGWRSGGVLALLVAKEEATKGIRDAITRSKLPMGFLNITEDGRIRQFLWNQSAAEWGLEGVGVALRHSLVKNEDGNKVEVEEEITLTWKGRPWTAGRKTRRKKTVKMSHSV